MTCRHGLAWKLDGSEHTASQQRNGNKIHTQTWFIVGLPGTEHLNEELFLDRKAFDACMSIARRTDASED